MKMIVAEEFEKQFTYLGENTEKCITFSVPIEKKLQELIEWRQNYRNHILQITI